jgi:hypothetical protein
MAATKGAVTKHEYHGRRQMRRVTKEERRHGHKGERHDNRRDDEST